MRRGSILVVAFAVLLCACGGSDGSARVAPTDQACQDTSCGPEAEPTRPAEPPPAPLRCDGLEGAACPAGYRCVDDTADDCDPDTGTDCGGLCILGEELPGCGLTDEPCPPGTVCVEDPACAPAADCAGRCQPEATGACATDGDCPALPAVCNECPDGSASCPISRCEAGQCIIDAPACPAPLTCGGIADVTCPPGFTCTDDPDDLCDDHEGADCPGLCVPETPTECGSDADCPLVRAPCHVCADGSEVCPKSWCNGGRCHVAFPSCGPALVCGADGSGCAPGETCVPDPADACDLNTGANVCTGKCVIIDVPRPCGEDGGSDCPPGYECSRPDGTTCEPNAAGAGCGGVCTPGKPRECTDDADCPPVPGPCLPCPDQTVSCARSACANGVCAVVLDACTGSDFCGGIAGFPCPPGLTCVDDPNDDCDPLRGGADCAGLCVRQDRPKECGGFSGAPCPPGHECADAPNDDCDPARGGADCPGICRPVASPTCNGDDDCAIGAPCRICPDGTAACPQAACVNGGCAVRFAECAADGSD